MFLKLPFAVSLSVLCIYIYIYIYIKHFFFTVFEFASIVV